MSSPGGYLNSSNPFSTRFVRPGAMDYLFPPELSAGELASRLAELGWRAQIVGPHGSGKSTLIASLLPRVESAGRRCVVFALRDGQRRLPAGWARQARRESARMVVVDGYEQLSWISRLLLKLSCRSRGWGLLVTAHGDVGLPTLLITDTSLPLAQSIVARLMPDGEITIGPEVVAKCFAMSQGNLRETLFALYDVYEQRRVAPMRD